jgi:hypothetical protein
LLEVIYVPDERDPLESPERRALLREAALVRHLLGSGATALGRADYAIGFGEYYSAFFGLSIGFERLAKLILVTDYAISKNGQMPPQEFVCRYGHKLARLMDAVDAAIAKHALTLEYERPNNPVCAKIVECLDDFADAGRGRYANFATLGDPNLGNHEPIRLWWGKVAGAILNEEYFSKGAQERAEAQGSLVAKMISPAIVWLTSETRDPIRDVASGSIRTAQNYIVRRQSRYYALTIARWLADAFSKLAAEACYTHKIYAFFGVEEYFRKYRLDDSLLRRYKIWPLKEG